MEQRHSVVTEKRRRAGEKDERDYVRELARQHTSFVRPFSSRGTASAL